MTMMMTQQKELTQLTIPTLMDYVEKIRPNQFEFSNIADHHIHKGCLTGTTTASASSSGSSLFLKEIHKQVEQLKKDLPLHMEATICVRVDPTTPQLVKAIITGPSNTPYNGGCFEFDIFCGNEFPRHPPNVTFMTTGNGTVRFNPNLYANGTVCLSLLGTWSGFSPSENWSPTSSSIWQVLVSIQSAILGVPFPFCNEPGREGLIGPNNDLQQRRDPNGGYEALRIETIKYAIADKINNPPIHFKKFIEDHFMLRRHQILWTVLEWLQDAVQESPGDDHFENLCKAVEEFLFPALKQLSRRLPGGYTPTRDDLSTLQMHFIREYCKRIHEIKSLRNNNDIITNAGNIQKAKQLQAKLISMRKSHNGIH